jgi:hypothetical protein
VIWKCALTDFRVIWKHDFAYVIWNRDFVDVIWKYILLQFENTFLCNLKIYFQEIW